MDLTPLFMYSVPAFLALALIAAFALFAVSAVRVTQRNNAQPVRTLLAQVVRKSDGYYAPYNVVNFQTEDGEMLELSVANRKEYARLTTGTSGMLTFRGWDYKKFVPAEPPVTSPFSSPE